MSFQNKYAPKSLADIVFPDAASDLVVNRFVSIGAARFPGNILLYGPAGTGKTAVACLVAEALLGENHHYNALFLNGADYDTAAQIKKPVSFHAKGGTIGSRYRIVIIDELGSMKKPAQEALRSMITAFNKDEWCSFIFTTNDIGNVDVPLQSRCKSAYFGPATPDLWLPRATSILAAEGITNISQEKILSVLKRSGGDVRKVLDNLEMMSPLPQIVPQAQIIQFSPLGQPSLTTAQPVLPMSPTIPFPQPGTPNTQPPTL